MMEEKKMNDEDFMREAIKDAEENSHRFGAVIVKDGKIISKAGKRPKSDARYHAETQAISNAGKTLMDVFYTQLVSLV